MSGVRNFKGITKEGVKQKKAVTRTAFQWICSCNYFFAVAFNFKFNLNPTTGFTN
jgi:hypothetical protein